MEKKKTELAKLLEKFRTRIGTSDRQRRLSQELHEKFVIPPMIDDRPVFRKGGIGY